MGFGSSTETQDHCSANSYWSVAKCDHALFLILQSGLDWYKAISLLCTAGLEQD